MIGKSCVLAAILLSLGAAHAPASQDVRAAPSPFEIVIDGFRSPATPVEKFFSGFRNEGPFSASTPFCSSGYAVDLDWLGPLGLVHGTRQFSCNDGSGSITARQRVLETDLNTYLRGDWRVVEGTGPFAKLRGKGTFATVLSGDDFAARTFRETWTGLVDFDDTAPAVAITTARAQKLRRPAGAYSVRVVISARDEKAETAVAYRISLHSGDRVAASRSGQTKSGTASATLRVRLWQSERRTLRLVIVGSDALGNEHVVSRSLRLPS
jgi:hypothetical protein